MKRILLIALAIALSAPLAAFAAPYPDVPERHWAYAAISAMSDAGAIIGFPDGSFQPSETVTYGEFIKMAYLAAGGADPGNSQGGGWAADYYKAGAGAGLYSRFDIQEGALGFAIPRKHMALILSRILGDVGIKDYSGIQEGIADVGPETAYEYDITKAYAEGLVTGYPDGTFGPEETLSRAEAAAVIHRLISSGARLSPMGAGEEAAAEPGPEAGESPQAGGGASTLLERIEQKAKEGSTAPFQGVIDDFAFTKPFSDIVDGPVLYLGAGPVLYYEIFEDYPHKMRIGHNLLGEEVLIVGYDNAAGLLIKDRKVIAELGSGRTIDGEFTSYVRDGDGKAFPDFDYVAVIGYIANSVVGDNAAILIPNNL